MFVQLLLVEDAQSSILPVGFSVGTSEVKSDLWEEEEEGLGERTVLEQVCAIGRQLDFSSS